MNFKECLDKGLLKKNSSAPNRVVKSIEIAERFLTASRNTLEIEEYEMAEIASYYLFSYYRFHRWVMTFFRITFHSQNYI